MANRKIDAQTEVRIVALIARGDSYSSIQSELKNSGVEISLSGITDIKQRNTMALDQIKTSLAAHEVSKATRILDKARKQIEEKLDSDEYISVKDLTTVSKEMFNQSQIESGKPTSIASNPEENKKNLMTLLKAINDKDEIGMLHSIFPDS